MKVIIIEDEINAYHYLKTCIQSSRNNIEVIAHIESVEDAVNWLYNNPQPDLIFLDIQLSDGLSFEIFEHVDIECPIIFTTAFNQYALDAFKVNSVDYLLKPIHIDDLERALVKFEKLNHKANVSINSQLSNLIQKLNQQTKQRCLVKKGSHYEFIDTEDIKFVHSDDGITLLYSQDGHRYIYNKTIEKLIKNLDPNIFFQINRGQIININSISKVQSYYNQRLKINLRTPTKGIELLVTRSKVGKFKEWLDQ